MFVNNIPVAGYQPQYRVNYGPFQQNLLIPPMQPRIKHFVVPEQYGNEVRYENYVGIPQVAYEQLSLDSDLLNAKQLMEAGKFQEAEAVYYSALKNYPANNTKLTLYLDLAKLYEKTNNLSRVELMLKNAIYFSQSLIDTGHTKAQLHIQLADLYVKQGRLKEAEQEYTEYGSYITFSQDEQVRNKAILEKIRSK